MKNLILVISLLAGPAVHAEKTLDLFCEFPSVQLKISIPKFSSSHDIGTSGLREAVFYKKGEKTNLTSLTPISMARSSWVSGDLGDQRPTALLDFSGQEGMKRLAIYYCAGDGKTVEAKFFAGKTEHKKDSSFVSDNVSLGTCKGEDLTKILTNNCSNFK